MSLVVYATVGRSVTGHLEKSKAPKVVYHPVQFEPVKMCEINQQNITDKNLPMVGTADYTT